MINILLIFVLNEVLKLIEILKPKLTILTNLHTEMDYKEIKKDITYW